MVPFGGEFQRKLDLPEGGKLERCRVSKDFSAGEGERPGFFIGGEVVNLELEGGGVFAYIGTIPVYAQIEILRQFNPEDDRAIHFRSPGATLIALIAGDERLVRPDGGKSIDPGDEPGGGNGQLPAGCRQGRGGAEYVVTAVAAVWNGELEASFLQIGKFPVRTVRFQVQFRNAETGQRVGAVRLSVKKSADTRGGIQSSRKDEVREYSSIASSELGWRDNHVLALVNSSDDAPVTVEISGLPAEPVRITDLITNQELGRSDSGTFRYIISPYQAVCLKFNQGNSTRGDK